MDWNMRYGWLQGHFIRERQEGSMDSRWMGGRCGGRRVRKSSSSCSSSLSETKGRVEGQVSEV